VEQHQAPIQGPVEQWKPCEADLALIGRLVASTDELDQAYGQAYLNGCFVHEWSENLCAVGELDTLMELELRSGIEVGVNDLTAGDCVHLAFPGSGSTRAESVLDGLRQVLENREARDRL